MFNTTLAVLLAGALQVVPPSPPQPTEPGWRRFAECSAAHYADAQIIDLNRTLPMKAAIMDLGRRYAKTAVDLRHQEVGDSKDKAFAYTKAYILERTRLLATHTRPEVQAMIGGCPRV